MHKADVIKFFDSCAPDWDRNLIKSDDKINRILDLACVRAGSNVLDVACGTGVLIPYYLERQVTAVTAVDISCEMIKIAKSKYTQDNVRFICGDMETLSFDRQFDAIVIYNAFPHFPNPKELIAHLSTMLKRGGTLTVAHGMSRKEIDQIHEGSAGHVSCGLLHEDDLTELFAPNLDVIEKISNEEIYVVVGRMNDN